MKSKDAMPDWKAYWNSRPNRFDDKDYFRQIGKTLGGRPINDSQFQCMVTEIRKKLKLEPSDFLLDLCCGNGLITKEIAKVSAGVVGIDFSEPLIEIALRDHHPANVTYKCMSLLDLGEMQQTLSRPFDKVLFYDALQHFEKSDLLRILKSILLLTTEERVILIGGIPHRSKKQHFYNTPKRRFFHFTQQLFGWPLFGTWWDEKDFQTVCTQLGLQCQFHSQQTGMYNSDFRFDVTIF